MKKTIVVIIAILLVGVVAYRAIVNYGVQRRAMNQKPEEKIVPVRTTTPKSQEIVDKMRALGSIQADTEVMVYPKTSGKIAQNRVAMGTPVKPGTLLAVIHRDEVGYQFKPYEVVSEVTGVVSRILLNPGASVSPATPLMSIVSVDRVKAIVAVDELKIRFVRIGMPVRLLVQAYPDEAFSARVSAISPVCQPQTRAVDVEVVVSNPGYRLKPGMYAEMEMALSSRRALVLPVAALVERGGQKYAFVLTDGRVKMAPVATGAVVGDEIEITSGLSGRETIVSTGADRLEDGDRVNVVGR